MINPTQHRAWRDTIYMEDATVISQLHHDDCQHTLRLHSPQCASKAIHGQFVHLQCDHSLPLRRPLSIMRTRPKEGYIDLLYREVGQGTALLAKQSAGTTLSLLGPVGSSFVLHEEKPIRILIGGGVGIPPLIFTAETIHQQYPDDSQTTYAFMGSESPFPFTLIESVLDMPGIDTLYTINDLENISIACRLASLNGLTGCYNGYVSEMADRFLQTLTSSQINMTEIFCCGPRPMLYACQRLAEKYSITCQMSLEEYMACAVGGCAGCVVKIRDNNGHAMKRVCVDGPVFDASLVEL